MKLLLDECVTRFVKRDLGGHEVYTVEEAGFKGLENGDLLRAASGTYDVLITVDQNLPYQQNVTGLDIAIVVGFTVFVHVDKGAHVAFFKTFPTEQAQLA